jgi:hypothetical protein
MGSIPTIIGIGPDEQYFCENCKVFHPYPDVWLSWVCPICKQLLKIRIEVDNFIHQCVRITPEQLIIGDRIIISPRFAYYILAIEKIHNSFRIALKEYGVSHFGPNVFMTKITGRWIDPKEIGF